APLVGRPSTGSAPGCRFCGTHHTSAASAEAKPRRFASKCALFGPGRSRPYTCRPPARPLPGQDRRMPRLRRLLRLAIVLVLLVGLLGVGTLGVLYWMIAPTLPDVQALRDVK